MGVMDEMSEKVVDAIHSPDDLSKALTKSESAFKSRWLTAKALGLGSLGVAGVSWLLWEPRLLGLLIVSVPLAIYSAAMADLFRRTSTLLRTKLKVTENGSGTAH